MVNLICIRPIDQTYNQLDETKSGKEARGTALRAAITTL